MSKKKKKSFFGRETRCKKLPRRYNINNFKYIFCIGTNLCTRSAVSFDYFVIVINTKT